MASNNDPTNIWAWTHRDEKRLEQKGGQWQAILDGYHDFWRNYHDDHIAAELSISQALAAARETKELKWELLLRHWRLQLWLSQSQVKRALPEAVDLLSLATDTRVREVPQRICAYHDIVECYISMDAAGYYQEIVDNSQDVLSQLPQRHPCATCARSNLARAAAASHRSEEAEHWINQTKAALSERRHPGLVIGFAEKYALLGKWDEAEQNYLEARNLANTNKQANYYLDATLGLIHVYIARKEYHRAFETLNQARQLLKSYGGSASMARLLDVEGRFIAAAAEDKDEALNFLTRAARFYLDLGCYRDAADTALYAAEVAREHNLSSLPEETLELAARAVGQLPRTSQDLYQRLAAFDVQPLSAEDLNSDDLATLSAEEVDKKELAEMEQLLQVHIARQHFSDTCVALFRIGRWYGNHDQMRAAIDYLLLSAAIERLLKLSMNEREEALNILQNLHKNLPDGAVAAALSASEDGPPSWLAPLLADVSLDRWQWIIRALRAEIAGEPVVEPEPESNQSGQDFYSWLNHSGGMTGLIMRFRDKITPEECEQWAHTMDESAVAMDAHIDKMEQENPELAGHDRGPIAIMRGFAALARGTSLAEVEAMVPEPYTPIMSQTAELAVTPVWFHPGASPIDFLVEQMAQKAVLALQRHDPTRPQRLANLALRYKMMNFDLRQHESLVPIANFLDALSALILANGKELPQLDQPLEAPFDAVLAAVYQSSQATTSPEQV
ncbi:hypothetical protein KDA_45910 [Dictyobacter alpinus]|uniref:Uncharacterized protein n=1 Tax=Dictyobacter alpinus TaxID=2014873 RepID=A0A402BCU8_9CHLR|nr:hypothetical protein [Dictyobacter alpinus]GCE29107.1 hypothetical protein KDA_45910 [Dictyobacter alpinus]